jgi:hypothetical protein
MVIETPGAPKALRSSSTRCSKPAGGEAQRKRRYRPKTAPEHRNPSFADFAV